MVKAGWATTLAIWPWLVMAADQARPTGSSCRQPPIDTPAEVASEVSLARMRELVLSVQQSAGQVQDYTTVLSKWERFNGDTSPTVVMYTKWARPYRIYFKNIQEPEKGREILYTNGHDDDELVAHPGSFPDITVDLDIRGEMAMDGNHHPIDRASLLDLVELLVVNTERAARRDEGRARLREEKLWGRPVLKLEMNNVGGGWFHTVQEDETLWELADRYRTSMYHILHHNAERGWSCPDDVSAGDRVFVPRYYGGKFEVWLDRELNLPVRARVYDHHGQLYEHYEFRDLAINVGLRERDFDPDNPAYDF